MKLYEVNQEIADIINAADPETGELPEDSLERLDNLMMAWRDKAEGIALAIKNLKAESEAIDAERAILMKEADNLAKRSKAKLNRAERLRDFLAYILAGEKLNTPKVQTWYTSTESVDIDDGAFYSNQDYEWWCKQKLPEPDRKAIKAALKNGREIPGATLVQKTNLIIK